MDTTNNQINEEVPKVEEISNEEELTQQPIKLETETDQVNQEENIQQFFLSIKTPVEIGTIQIQVTASDTVFDIQTFLNETTETCLYSSYALHFKGEKLNEFLELSSIPELEDGSILEMLPVEYNERTARLHVKRLRDILNTGLLSDQNQPNPSLFSAFSFPEKSKLPVEQEGENETEQSETNQEKKEKKKSNGSVKSKSKKNIKVIDESKLQEEKRKEEITALKKYEKPLLSNYFPKQHSNTIQCVRSLNNSGWSPVPGYRKLQGDLFYLDVTLLEGNTLFITSNTKGFFVNQSTQSTFNPNPHTNSKNSFHSHCLHTVLSQASKSFKSGLHKVLNQLSQRHPYEMLPGSIPLTQWIGRPKTHPNFDMNRANDSVLIPSDIEFRGQPRDWNEELQGIRELPKSTFQERILRDRAFAKVHSEFIDTATKGAQAIISQSLLPINPLDNKKSHMFLYQNIFFSFPLDTREMFTECGGDKAARASANNDLKGIRLYNLADVDGLHTVGTCIIDYRGHRITAQTLVPGILSNESTSNVFYGSMDSKTLKFDATFHEKLNKAASMLHLAERSVFTEETPEPVTLCTAVDSKGIIGIDGRHYVLDLVRATPRDPNYPEPKDLMCILRPELIATYAEYIKETWLSNKFKEIKEKKLKEKKEKKSIEIDSNNNNNETEQNTTTTTTTTSEDDEDILPTEEDLNNLAERPPVVSFNPNLFTNVKIGGEEEEQKKDIDALKSVGIFLKNVIVPKLIEDFMLFNTAPIDGQNLTSIMHNRGINMRYLGYIASNEAAAKVPFIQDICFGEMVSRATKHIFNQVIAESDPSELSIVTAHFLNCFLGTATGSVSAEEMTKRYKQVQSKSVSTLTQVTLWEQIAQSIKEKYNFEITTHSVPMESRLIVLRSLCLKVGLQIQVRDYDFTTDFTFTSDDVLDLQCVVKHLNPRSSDGLDFLEHGRLYLSQRRFDLAKDLLSESLSILHQVHGPIYPDIATCYQNLAVVALYNDKLDEAIDHQKNCLIVTEKVNGLDHNETIHAYINLASYCQRAGRFNEAMGYYKHALYLMDLLGGEYNPERYQIYSTIAVLLQEQGDFELSIELLQLALKHQEVLVGPLHAISSSIYHNIAISYASMHKFTESIDYERKSYKILEKELGPEHYRTKESFTFIQQLTSTAVHIQKMKIVQYQNQQKQQQIKQTAKQLSQKLANPTPTTTLKKDELDRLQAGPVNDILKYINSNVRTSSTGRPKITKIISKQQQKPEIVGEELEQPKVEQAIEVKKPSPKQQSKSSPKQTTTTTTTTTTNTNNIKSTKPTKPISTTTSSNTTTTNTTNNKQKPAKKSTK